MSGDFSRDAFARILGPAAMALAEAEADAAPPPSPAIVERVRKIFAPSLTRLALQASGTASVAGGEKARAA